MASEPDNVDAVAVAAFTFSGAAITAAVVLLVQALYFTTEHAVEHERNVSHRNRQLVDYQSGELGKLKETKWVDRDTNRITIPVGVAMDKVVAEIQAGIPLPGAEAVSQQARNKSSAKKNKVTDVGGDG